MQNAPSGISCVATVVIGDRIFSSDWNTEAILLKNFKYIQLNFKDNDLSAADSIVCVVSLWAGINTWTLELSFRS